MNERIPLTDDELVDDRELESRDHDKFGHVDFVDELAELALTVPTATNIALYGPWGSGKSSLAALLEARFGDEKHRAKFVRFDALKHAEAPLSRQFLTHLRSKLDLHPQQQAAYRTTTTSVELQAFDRKTARQLARVCIPLFVIVGVAGVAVSLLYAAVWSGRFTEDFADAVTWLAPRFLAPPLVLGIVSTLIGSQLKVDRNVAPPQAPDDFEDEFRQIVAEAVGGRCGLDALKGKGESIRTKRRLIIFVDELDRCSPDEVAAVLETLRTFLAVEGCVFIVAADQQALEEALSRKVRQATPNNTTVPYYSVGSAYLDKIFQYQMALPPLKPARLTAFALELVSERRGVWTRVAAGSNLDDVISVLIPTHVDSPRRVKALLNHFALLYRLAEVRQAREQLAPNVSSRAAEIAKLACLRIEFPLFAADLTFEPRLPELVRQCADFGESAVKTEREDVLARVKQWAGGQLPTDEVFSEDKPLPKADGTEDTTHEAVRQRHTDQMLNYLRKSALVPGPARDLIYLESAAAVLDGLDPLDADDLERAAIDGDDARVREIIDRLGVEGKRSSVRLLASLVRHAIGLEGVNVIRTLLRVLPDSSVIAGDPADEAARAIAAHRYNPADPQSPDSETPDTDDLAGALKLALASSHTTANQLRAKVLQSESVIDDPAIRTQVILVSPQLIDAHASRLGEVIAESLLDDPTAAVALWDQVDGGLPVVALDHATVALQGRLEIPEVPGRLLQAYAHAIDAAPDELVHRLAGLYLGMGNDELIDGVLEHSQSVVSSSDPQLVRGAARRATTRPVQELSRWLSVFDPHSVTSWLDADQVETFSTDLVARVADAWGAEGAPLNRDGLVALAEALSPYHEAGLLQPSDDVRAAVRTALSRPVANEGELAAYRENFVEPAELLADTALIEPGVVADAALSVVETVIRSGVSGTQDFWDRLVDIVDEYRASATRGVVVGVYEAVRDAAPATWAGLAHNTALELSVWLRENAQTVDAPFTASALRAVVDQVGSTMQPGVATWLKAYAETAEDVVAVIEPWLPSSPTTEIGTALQELVTRWRTEPPAAGEHDNLCRRLVEGVVTARYSADWLHFASVTDADPVTAEHLIELFSNDLDDDQKRILVQVWAKVGTSKAGVRRRFTDLVLLPLARSGHRADYETVVSELSLLGKLSPGSRTPVIEALRQVARDLGVEKTLDEKLERAGLRRRTGLIGRKKDV